MCIRDRADTLNKVSHSFIISLQTNVYINPTENAESYTDTNSITCYVDASAEKLTYMGIDKLEIDIRISANEDYLYEMKIRLIINQILHENSGNLHNTDQCKNIYTMFILSCHILLFEYTLFLRHLHENTILIKNKQMRTTM